MIRTLIVFLLFSNLILGQSNTEITYFKDKYGENRAKKGPYMLTVTKINDSVTQHVFSKTKKQQKIWTKSYIDKQPYGTWERFDKKGNVKSTIDYNFIVKYGAFIPEGATDRSSMGQKSHSASNLEKIQQHIMKQFRYPEFAQANGIQGKVTLQFTIDESGKIGNLSIIKGVHISLDTECFRIMKGLPELEPHEENGKRVMAYYKIPITFKMV